MTYFAPPVELRGNTDQQISDIYTYLFKLANQLNLSFEHTTPAAIFEEVNKALEHADSGKETDKAIVDNYQQLKALVIKTADYTAGTGNSKIEEYYGTFVAKSEFGEYKEETNATITQTSTDLTQMYEYAASLGILGNGESDVDITDIETWTQAYIKSGLLYYDNATPKYGVAVGNVNELVTIDGHEVINRQNLLATFTADRLSFWQSGNEVAYLSSGSMYFPSAHISGGSIEIGGSESGGQHVTGPFYVDNVGNLVASSATISGTLTAQSGSKLGNWDINTAIYNGKTSLSDTSHSGIYIGTDGLYLGDGASTETYVKLLPDGTLTANSATISGTLTAGSGSKIADWTVGKTTGTNPVSYIYSGSRTSYSSTASGIYIGTDGISMGSPTSTTSGAVGVQISSSGALTCRGATIRGNITAESLTITSGATVTGISASGITTGTMSADRISGGTIDASNVTITNLNASNISSGSLSANRISGGTINASNVTITNLNASNITSGTLSSSYIKLTGWLALYNGNSIAGYIGYATGSSSYAPTSGIGMASSYGSCMVTSGGAALKTDSGEVFADSQGAGMKVIGSGSYSVVLRLLSSSIGFHPAVDGSISLGASSYRWGTIYSSSSTISTSDRQVKHDISYNIDNYEALFDELKPVKYKFDDGTSNRYHTGFISQDIEDSLDRLGMSTLDFAGFIKSPKYDDEGHPIEGYNYALRYEEFIALAVLKIKKLEARIAALEGA